MVPFQGVAKWDDGRPAELRVPLGSRFGGQVLPLVVGNGQWAMGWDGIGWEKEGREVVPELLHLAYLAWSWLCRGWTWLSSR